MGGSVVKRLWIDCDPGQDDAVAILMAAAHDEAVSVCGISTVHGNNTIDHVTYSARMCADAAGVACAVARGADRPLVKPAEVCADSLYYHGQTGMDGPDRSKEPRAPLSGRPAAEALWDALQASQQPMVIAALAPLTNLAMLFNTHPEAAARIERIYLMGGSLSQGNITPYAEFNIWTDPEAAQIVFSSMVPITMAGLDATGTTHIRRDESEALRDASAVGRFYYDLLRFYTQGELAQKDLSSCCLFDAYALAALLSPASFSGERGTINVVLDGQKRGQTVFLPSESGHVTVLLDADHSAVSALITSSVQTLSRREVAR